MIKALTIAGSDSGAGAGIQADLKTFAALGVYGTTVITAITAQNTRGIYAVKEVGPEMVAAQLEAVLADIQTDAVKIGMLYSRKNMEIILKMLRKYRTPNIVLDPVMVSSSGAILLKREALEYLVEKLLPLTDIVTPNLPETELLTGIAATNPRKMEEAAAALYKMGPRAVVVKGGHLVGEPLDLFYDGQRSVFLEATRFPAKHIHGTGCAFSSAIAAYLARGSTSFNAARQAKQYISQAIGHSFIIGSGARATNHFFEVWPKIN